MTWWPRTSWHPLWHFSKRCVYSWSVFKLIWPFTYLSFQSSSIFCSIFKIDICEKFLEECFRSNSLSLSLGELTALRFEYLPRDTEYIAFSSLGFVSKPTVLQLLIYVNLKHYKIMCFLSWQFGSMVRCVACVGFFLSRLEIWGQECHLRVACSVCQDILHIFIVVRFFGEQFILMKA